MQVKTCFLFAFIAATIPCAAQYQENLPQARPIPPNAASLFKTLERPIGSYTGTIPISFPLCSVSSGSLTARVSLDYNSTGGIRVEELGGPIGLGFNLADGGGRITQIVRGKQDDQVGGLINTAYGVKPSNFGCNLSNMNQIRENSLDMEPDVFMYSFNGHSGKFYFKENGEIILTKNDGIKIEYEMPGGSDIIDWTITDENGTQYWFANKVVNQSYYSSNGGSTSNSVSSVSWSLVSMGDMGGENTIGFSYTGTGNVFSTYSGGYMPIYYGIDICDHFNTSYDQGSVTTDGGEYLISRIDAQTGYIIFNSTAAYPYGPKRITSILLYDWNNTIKKKYTFNYGSAFESNRQKLISFSEFATSGTDSLTTKFDYIESENLPDVFSPNVDIWGFANGASNYNTGLIPNIVFPIPGVNVTLNWTFWANRNANWYAGRANILRKISYQTGGYREIEYEGNTAFANGDFFSYHPDPAYLWPYTVNRNFNETSFYNVGTYSPCLQHLFTVNSTTGYTQFSYTLNNPDWSCGAYSVKIMRLYDSTDMYGGSEAASFTSEPTGSHLLVNGYYRIDVFIGDNQYNWACTMDGIEGSWDECTLNDTTVSTPYGSYPHTARNAGGVRVREVRDYDPVANKLYKTEYKYKMYSTDSNLTSGLLVSPVNIISTQNIWDCHCQYYTLSPGSNYPLSTEGSSFVVYPEVRTIDSANGWTDRLYSFAPDIPSTTFPLTPTDEYAWRRGNLVSEKIYNSSGLLLKRKDIGYTERYGSKSQSGYRFKPYWYDGIWVNSAYYESPPSPYIDPDLAACQSWGVMGIFWTPGQTVETIYTPAGNVTDSTIYTYGNYNDYYYLKNEKKVNSNAIIKQRTYKYVFNNNSDFKLGLSSSEQSMKTTLLGRNFFQPLEVVDSIKTNGGSYSFASGAKYIFGNYNNDGNLHLSKYRSYTTTTDSTELNFTAYDSSGNLREQYQTGDIKEVYLWGYGRTYPVAKVSGSDLSTVLGLVNLSVINGLSSDATMRSELNKIRTGLANSKAQVTTYTYNLLYGMSSMTDPSGKIIYYEYDLLGRLKLVRDQNNNIIKKYEYKLNNPQ